MRTSVEVHNHLQSLDIKYEMVALPGPVQDSATMAELLGLDLSCIIKILVFIADGLPLMVLVPGDKRVNHDKIKAAAGAERISFAAERDMIEITDYQPRAIPPIAWKGKADVIADSSLVETGIAYTTGGQPNVVLKMHAADLIKITGAKVADIT